MTYFDNLDLFAWEPSAPAPAVTRPPTIAERFASWSIVNGHVLAELLRLARAQIDQGATFLSVKKLWEECRVSLSATREGGYRLNNDFTSRSARWLIEQEPRLATVIRTRKTGP